MSTTLPLFWNLTSALTEERLDASVKLITALEEFQANKAAAPTEVWDEPRGLSDEKSSDEGGTESTTKLGGHLNSEDVSYALRRLVRGLASPRESSRLGFSLLTRLNTVDAASLTSLIIETSVTSSSMKGQEVRDTLFARLFGLTAIIQSGLLFRSTRLTTSLSSPNELGLPASSLASYQTTISELLNLGDKKSWLRESSWWAIILAVKSLHLTSPAVEWQDPAIQWTVDKIYRGERAKEWTPDKLALTLCFQKLSPFQPWKECLSPTFRNSTLISSPNLPMIARILKESENTDELDFKSPSGGAFKVQLHSVWDEILQALAAGKCKVSFAEFYRVCVDESLFDATSSPERKSWGFQVFERALAIVPSDQYQYLFTPNFMRSWINHLSSSDRRLHKAAKKTAAEIVKAVERNPSIGFSLVTHLHGKHGNQQFDRVTRTKTVETILASTDIEGVKTYTALLIDQLKEDGSSNTDLCEKDTKRRYVFEQLAALMRNGSIPKDDEWINSVLELFILHALFTVIKKNKASSTTLLHHVTKPPLSDALRVMCRTKLFTILGDLCSQIRTPKDEASRARATSSTTGGAFWLTKAVKIIEEFEQDPVHVTSLIETEDDVKRLRARARKLLKNLHKKQAAQDDASQGIELLISALLLLTYDEGDDIDVFESCLYAAERLLGLSKELKNAPKDDEHPPIDLLVDAIVGLLDEPSAFGKAVAIQAFGMLSGEVESSTIDLILTQLEHRDVNGEDNESEGGTREDVDTNSTDRIPEIEENENSSDEGEQGSDEHDSDEDGSEESETEADPEFRRQVAEALQVNGMAAADNDGSDSDSENEVPLDDDQMMQLDEHLAKVFRSQAGNTKERKGAQREATHFKIRILDLVDTFLSKQPQNRHLPRIVLPLVNIIVSAGPDERQLSDKTIGILRARMSKLKDHPQSGFDKDAIVEDVKNLHELARRMSTPEISSCSIYLSKVLQGDPRVLDAYRASIDDFSQRKNSKLSPNFLKDFVLRQTTSAWRLREHIAKQTVPGIAVNVYRQMQMWQLVQTLLSQITPHCREASVVDELFAFIPLIRDSLYRTLILACQRTEHSANAAQVKELLKIALQAVRLTRKTARPAYSISSYWDETTFEGVKANLASAERFKTSPAIQASVKQLSSLLSPSVQKEKASNKRKGDNRETNANPTTNGTQASESRKKQRKARKHKPE
ncbi:DNA polymerase phi subunit [Ceratobasidium theobromae]|uniref:DNA polymerase phi subunit n=1 Tax=Ceratobasidium theobromae TaxID=1582974 RepID=A0A5N5QLR0_9AGAM|nr:DNA polymerase phi subunit [Ceratobasidium theobromae]